MAVSRTDDPNKFRDSVDESTDGLINARTAADAANVGSVVLPGAVGNVVRGVGAVIGTEDDAKNNMEKLAAIARRIEPGYTVDDLEQESFLGDDPKSFRSGDRHVSAVREVAQNGVAIATGSVLLSPLPFGAFVGGAVGNYVYDSYMGAGVVTTDTDAVYDYVTSHHREAADTFDIFRRHIAVTAPEDIGVVNHFTGAAGFGADEYVQKHWFELLGNDFIPGQTSAIQYITDKINAGEIEPAQLAMRIPRPKPPMRAPAASVATEQGDLAAQDAEFAGDIDVPSTLPFPPGSGSRGRGAT